MERIKELFETIEDTRHQGYVKHKLSEILIMVMGSVICGITELSEMLVYFEKKLEFYKEHSTKLLRSGTYEKQLQNT